MLNCRVNNCMNMYPAVRVNEWTGHVDVSFTGEAKA